MSRESKKETFSASEINRLQINLGAIVLLAGDAREHMEQADDNADGLAAIAILDQIIEIARES